MYLTRFRTPVRALTLAGLLLMLSACGTNSFEYQGREYTCADTVGATVCDDDSNHRGTAFKRYAQDLPAFLDDPQQQKAYPPPGPDAITRARLGLAACDLYDLGLGYAEFVDLVKASKAPMEFDTLGVWAAARQHMCHNQPAG